VRVGQQAPDLGSAVGVHALMVPRNDVPTLSLGWVT
jgi:hypothetical protein